MRLTKNRKKRKRCTNCPDSEITWTPRREMAHKRPRIHPNGNIEYIKRGAEPPPDIEGYIRDPTNAWRFLPKWQGCEFRVQTNHIKPCGNETIKAFCGHQDSPVGQGNEVTLQICEACPLKKTRK